jgi:hypothetical protein
MSKKRVFALSVDKFVLGNRRTLRKYQNLYNLKKISPYLENTGSAVLNRSHEVLITK